MTNVIFSRKEFEKHIKITDEIIEKISLFGTPLERLNEEEIEVEVFPNRPDLISLYGFIRSFKSFIGKESGLKKYKVKKPEKDFKVIVESQVKEIRPFTSCAIVKALSLNDEKIKSIIDLQEKLHLTLGRNRKKVAIGIYPLEKITLPITYTAKKSGEIKFIPLDSKRELSAKQILQKHPVGKKYAELLKGAKLFPIFIDSANKILSMPPIINSKETGKITEETKDVFVECSGFDRELLKKALNIVVTILAEMGGKIYSMEIADKKTETTPNLKPDKIKFSAENINKLLGIKLNQKEIEKLLKKMGYDVKKNIAYIPAWRTDIIHEVDIIEDIAIAYGYNNFTPEAASISTTGFESKKEKIKDSISEILIGLGCIETLAYHLIKEEEAKSMQMQNLIQLENSKTEYKLLRPNLFIPALRILSENTDAEYPQKIFEIGRIFEMNNKTKDIAEKDHLLIALTPSNFTNAKQHLDYLMKSLNLQYGLKHKKIKGLIEGRTGEICLNEKPLGYIGEVHPAVLNKWHLKMPLAVIEISLDEIYDLIN